MDLLFAGQRYHGWPVSLKLKSGLTVVIFVTGCCNLIYELALAQMTSSFFGGTLYHYTLNIGLFILSMGIGSILADRIKRPDVTALLIRIEAALFVLALTMPFYVVFAEKFFSLTWFNILLWLTNMLLGFLSGFELPLFNRMFNDEHNAEKVLFFDYLGMFSGSVAFSFLLFPVLGAFGTLWVAALLNWLVLFGLVWVTRKSWGLSAGLGVGLVLTLLLIISNEHLLGFLQGLYVN